MPNKKSVCLLILLLTTIFYIYTISPSLAWGDGARLQSEAISGESLILAEVTNSGEFSPDPFPFSKVGVTAWDHPLYIVMGHTLVRALPFVDPLWLVNMISAAFGAASIALIFLLCYQFTNSLHASGYAALSLAVSHTFWWHSSTPEVYTLFIFLLLLSFYFFDQFERTGKYSSLTISAFFLGVAATDHILAFLAIPAFGLYFLLSGNVRRHFNSLWKLILPLLGFLPGFSLYIIQFIRVSIRFPVNEIMGAAIGSIFLNGFVAFSLTLLAEGLLTYLLFLVLQFGPIGIVLGALGIRRILDHADSSLRKIVAFYVVYALFGIFYRVPDQFAFFLTSHIFFALLIGMGATHLFKERVLLTSGLILTILATPPLYHAIPLLAQSNGVDDSILKIPQIGTGLRNGLAYYMDPNKRGDFSAYNFGDETLSNLPPNSVVIAELYTDADEYFILRHFQKVMGLRPDVTILGFPTDDPFSFDPTLVLDAIDDSVSRRPIYLASLSEKFYAATKLIGMYCIVPENNLYRLYQKGEDMLQCLGINSITE